MISLALITIPQYMLERIIELEMIGVLIKWLTHSLSMLVAIKSVQLLSLHGFMYTLKE